MSRALVVATLFLLAGLAGCLSGEPDPATDTSDADQVAGFPSYVELDEKNLTPPVHDILPMVTDRVAATIDGITLFVEVHLPDGEGPWPTILHSSPYNALGRVPGMYPTQAFPEQSMVNYYVPRGYAFVVADVRGFGESEGCVEVWGPNEQQDQYDLVEWIAEQGWSDGNVGMIGVSYPGTTPMEAAVMAPPHLKAIVAVAGLTDPYFDWHFGGVPNGESYGSNVAYQGIGAVPPVNYEHGADWVKAAVNAGCGTAQLVTASYQPDGVYTDYYQERNLSARVKDVQAAVLYTQGFRDGNVKPSQLLNWFNELDVPKKGIFGQWGHSNPARGDWKQIEQAWFDEHLKGIDTGIMDGPVVEVTTNLDTWRADEAFPTSLAEAMPVHLDARNMELAWQTPSEEASEWYRGERLPLPSVPPETDIGRSADPPARSGAVELVFEGPPLDADLYVSGQAFLDFHAAIHGESQNTLFYATLEAVPPSADEDPERIVFGALNAALRDSYENYEPVPAGETIHYRLPFQPREYVVEEGHSLRLTIRSWGSTSSVTPEGVGPHNVVIHTGPETGSFLDLPVLRDPADIPVPYEED